MPTDTPTYRPLSSAIPAEQTEKLTGLSLLDFAQGTEDANPDQKTQDQKEDVKREEVKETHEPDQKSVEPKSESKSELDVDNPFGDQKSKEEVKPEDAEADLDKRAEAEFKESQSSQKKQRDAFMHKDREIRRLKKEAAEAENLRAKVQELESRGPEVKPDPQLQQRADALDKQLKETQARLKSYEDDATVFRIEKTDEFQQKVQKPYEEEIAPIIKVLSKATQGQVSKETFDMLATMDPVQAREKLRELRESLEPEDYTDLAAAIPKYREIIKNNIHLRENAKNILSLRQREQEEQMQMGKQEYETQLNRELQSRDQELTKKFFGQIADPELRQMAEDAARKQGERMKDLDWYKTDVATQAQLLVGAKNYPVIVAVMSKQIKTFEQMVDEKDKRIKELESAQEKLTKVSPNAGGSSGGSREQASDDEPYKGKLDGKKLVEMAG